MAETYVPDFSKAAGITITTAPEHRKGATAVLITRGDEKPYWYPAETADNWENCPAFAIQPFFVKSLIDDPTTKIEFVSATTDKEGNLVTEVIEVLKEPA